jgi:serine/threonine-protein kinase HipA
MTSTLAVWLSDRRVGTLERTAAGEVVYSPGIDVPLTVAASGLAAWSPQLTRNWFDGLLPEGDRRVRLAARFGLRSEDTFGLLAEIGWECAGAVAVLPEGQSPTSGRYEQIDEAGVAERLDALPSIDLDPDDAIRMSLGGAQDKLLLARIGDRWALPIDGAPSTHILKPEPDLRPGLAAAEAWALRVAGAATEASETIVTNELGVRPVIVVTRYDRQHPGDRIVRLHQEDLCQALGLPVGLKYARPAHPEDPSLARLARILVERAVDPPTELIRLLQQVAASVALRNADAHAKNISLLHQGNAVRLAPLYDVAPTIAFLPRQTTLGLSIGGKFKLTEIGTEHLVAEAMSWGIPGRDATEAIVAVAADMSNAVEEADDLYPGMPATARELAIAGIFQIQQQRPGKWASAAASQSRANRQVGRAEDAGDADSE